MDGGRYENRGVLEKHHARLCLDALEEPGLDALATLPGAGERE